MPDPGYGPNGELIPAVGLVAFEAQRPPEPFTPADDVWTIWPLGETPLPFVSQEDDEVFSYVYLGGEP